MRLIIGKYSLVLVIILMANTSFAQFPPPAGIEGTTAIPSDSSIFIDWAIDCTINRGYTDISLPSLGLATYGTDTNGIGKPDNSVVSLGDGGIADLTFAIPVADGVGWDFAVFENSFSDNFLELAFVEVSSDGINFFRFPSVSLTQDTMQVVTFGEIEATKINNLAGKYRAGFGVPFDLNELKGIEGLDIHNVIHIRVVDVVGSLNPEYASHDSEGHIINDPWPTPFESSGFDLDCIGIINNRDNTSVDEHIVYDPLLVYPTPTNNTLYVKGYSDIEEITVYDISGKIVHPAFEPDRNSLEVGHLESGLYIIVLQNNNTIITSKFLKQ